MKKLLLLLLLATSPALAQTDTVTYVQLENPLLLRDSLNHDRKELTHQLLENTLLKQQNEAVNNKAARFWFVALLITVIGLGTTFSQ